jgi:hypothetical protein
VPKRRLSVSQVEAMVVLVVTVIVSSTVRLIKWYSVYVISLRTMSKEE